MKNRPRSADHSDGSTMSNWLGKVENTVLQRRLPVENLKCCPLCGVLNAVHNAECFVCRWHGGFDHDPDRIEDCLLELLERCPELADAMSEPVPVKLTLWQKARGWFSSLFRRR